MHGTAQQPGCQEAGPLLSPPWHRTRPPAAGQEQRGRWGEASVGAPGRGLWLMEPS